VGAGTPVLTSELYRWPGGGRDETEEHPGEASLDLRLQGQSSHLPRQGARVDAGEALRVGGSHALAPTAGEEERAGRVDRLQREALTPDSPPLFAETASPHVLGGSCFSGFRAAGGLAVTNLDGGSSHPLADCLKTGKKRRRGGSWGGIRGVENRSPMAKEDLPGGRTGKSPFLTPPNSPPIALKPGIQGHSRPRGPLRRRSSVEFLSYLISV
jgi:hypothetical protein